MATKTPFDTAYVRAFAVDVDGDPPPRLMLMTLAPLSAANRMAATIEASEHVPESDGALPAMPAADSANCTSQKLEHTLRDMTRALKAMPANPRPLFVFSPMVPATCVPCPS